MVNTKEMEMECLTSKLPEVKTEIRKWTQFGRKQGMRL